MKIKRKLIVILLAVLFTLAIRGWNIYQAEQNQDNLDPKNQWVHTSWQSLWTNINIKAQTDTLTFKQAVDSIAKFYTHYSQQFSSNSKLDSLIFNSELNQIHSIDSLEWQLLEYAEDAFDKTQGAIHPGIANLIQAYGLEYGQTPRIPDSLTLASEIATLNTLPYKTLDSLQVKVLQPNRHIALGAFSKGYAIDWAAQHLQSLGIKNFWIEIGGDLRTSGQSKGGRPWTAGLQNPYQEQGLFGTLELGPEPKFSSLATSGNYRQFFRDSSGQLHHHILNPKTGKSVQGRASVSVIANSAIESDLWATAFFILPQSDVEKILMTRPDLAVLILNSDSTFWESARWVGYKPMVDFLNPIEAPTTILKNR